MLSLRLLYNPLRHSQWAGRVGVLSASPLQALGLKVTLQFHPKERGHTPWEMGMRALLSLHRGFFFASSKCFIQLCFPCHERSAARQLNQTLHHWLFLRVLYSTSAIRPSRCKGLSLHRLYTDAVLQAHSGTDRPQSFTTTLRKIPLYNNSLLENYKINCE